MSTRRLAAALALLSLLATPARPRDEPPPGLVRHLSGRAADAEAATDDGPALLLMGGGRDVDAAFRWWRERSAGGDLVVLRTSGGHGYGPYLHEEIGGWDSVETLLVTTRALADDPWVRARLAAAEAIFLAGGDQATYTAAWRGTAVEAELGRAVARGAAVGGTSAGLAVLGGRAFTAREGTIRSAEALADPFDRRVVLEPGLLDCALTGGLLTDSHSGERGRLGRLVAFLARRRADGEALLGLAVDERTALCVEADGRARVVGAGAVRLVRADGPPEVCAPERPLTWTGLEVVHLEAGDEVRLPGGRTTRRARPLAVQAGALVD